MAHIGCECEEREGENIMADLIKQVPLVEVATIQKSDLAQIDGCIGLCISSSGVIFQSEAGEQRRELEVIGWLKGLAHLGENLVLVRRVDDGRLFKRGLLYEEGKQVAERYPQLFVR